jgi:protein TonB
MRLILLLLFTLSILIAFSVSGQVEEKSDTDTIIDPIETQAKFPGGMDSLKTFVAKNLIKPTNSQKTGKVFVEFIVNSDGTTTDFKVLRGLSQECDDQAIEVLKKMPKWTPGTMNRKPIRQKFVMPIIF